MSFIHTFVEFVYSFVSKWKLPSDTMLVLLAKYNESKHLILQILNNILLCL